MNSIEKELYDTFLKEVTDSEAHVECAIAKGLDGKITVSSFGHKAVLFCCACEILKNLAQGESEDLDMQKQYIEVVCGTVLAEFEMGGVSDE